MLDQKFIEELYSTLERPLFNVALRWTWNEAEAQELVQDAFLKLWRARRRVHKPTSKAYIYRVVLNLSMKHARRRDAWARVRRKMTGTVPIPGPEDSMMTDQLERAIRLLPAEQRNVLLLCEFSDLKQREIAELLGVPTGTVGSRRNLALGRLRKILDD